MDRRRVVRLAQMDLEEIGWRGRAFTRNAIHRVLSTSREPRWDRRSLARALALNGDLSAIRAAVTRGDWLEAHRGLADRLLAAPPRFVVAEAFRPDVVRTVRDAHPSAAADAAARADRIVAGEYDLLGYHGLRFGGEDGAPDWHVDPVHDRRAPREFWTDVRYLDPACGDHKIIWELNRHQHWLALGRAAWLDGGEGYRRRFLAELESWLAANPPLVGVNWASMLELGLRAISWVWALHFFVDGAAADDSPWIVDLLVALDRQLTEVEHNLSFYFSPNTHLLGEALALYVCGRVLPDLAASPRREQLGRRVLLDEIDRQILPDGGHCERSTHYHRYALDFYVLALAVARATDDVRAARFEDAVVRLGGAARVLADARGRLPRIGDDDGGLLLPVAGRAADDVRDSLAVAAALTGSSDLRLPESSGAPAAIPEEAYWMLGHPALRPCLDALVTVAAPDPAPSAALPDSGYYVSRAPGGIHLIVDGGAHGFKNAGHAHADALSMTLDVNGDPLLIDPGTGCYTVDPEVRDRFRSTALHNTLVVDGRPQSLPAGPFAWSATTDGRVRHWRSVDGFDYFEGAHDGYRPIEHRRHVLVTPDGLVLVADLVHGGRGEHTAAVHWHLDPRWEVALHGRIAGLGLGDDHRGQLVLPYGDVERFRADRDTGLGWQAPAYGRIEPATTVRITERHALPFWILSVFALGGDNPIARVDVLPVCAGTGRLAHAVAVQVTRHSSTGTMVIAKADASAPPGAWQAAGIQSRARVVFARATADGVEEFTILGPQ